MPRTAIVVRVPAAPPAATPGPAAGLSGPYIAWCKFGTPSAENILFIFAIHGLSGDAEVEWSANLGEGDEIYGPDGGHVLGVAYLSGGGGTVTAAVDGVTLGSVEYGPEACEA